LKKSTRKQPTHKTQTQFKTEGQIAMSQQVDTGYGTVVLTGTVPQYARVTNSGVVAGALTQDIGVAMVDGVSGEPIAVALPTKEGTIRMIAAAAISAGASVYGAASGKVSSVANGNLKGISREAATADGDVIEVVPINDAVQNPITLASANGAIAVAGGTVVITKTGTLAALTLAAPTAAQNGTILRVTSATALAHTVTAAGLIDDGVTGGSKTTATFAAFAGASMELMAYEGKWHTLSLKAVTIS
jgi:hypothetical protein